MSADFNFIECSNATSFETSDGNNIFINKIEGGIVVPEGSKITVESAYINVTGSDESVIEMTGRELPKNTVYEYEETIDINGFWSGEYVELVSTVKDNYLDITLQYYKNADMQYYFPSNYPFSNYIGEFPLYTVANGNNYAIRCVPKGMCKIYGLPVVPPFTTYHAKDENQKGILASTYASPYGYYFPHDNKRYTICQKTKATTFTLQTGTTRWRREHAGHEWDRDPGLYHYFPYNKNVEIQITQGENTPSSIAEQIVQQLNKTTEPEIITIKAWEDEPAKAAVWVNYTEVNATLKTTTPCLQAFEVATRRTFCELTKNNYQSNLNDNDELNAGMYDDNYKYLGIYNPELFTAGRMVEPDNAFYSGVRSHRVLNTHVLNIAAGINDYVFETDLEYSEEVLKPYSILFNYQTEDQSFYENYCAKDINATKDDYVFLHMDFEDYNNFAAARPRPPESPFWEQTRFGSDFEDSTINIPDFSGNPNMTNALYIKYDKTQKDLFSRNSAYGVFTPYRNLQVDGKLFCKFTVSFRTSLTGTNDFFTFPISSTVLYLAGTGMNQALLSEVRKFGWDTHLSANGNQSILLHNGMKGTSNLQVNVPTEYTTEKAVAKTTISQLNYLNFRTQDLYSNSFILDDGSAAERFYDTGLNLLYLGSDNAQLGFDLDESRFIFKNFHTPRFEKNTGLAGWDSATTNLATGSDGKEQIFIASTDTTAKSQVSVPLTINTNANTAVYQISPNKIGLEQSSIYGLGSFVNTSLAHYLVNKNCDGLKTNTVFDSACGIFIINFGVDANSFTKSLWDMLGFSLIQVKNNLNDKHDFSSPNYLNRQERKLNQGVNIVESIKYPFTTNANIETNEIKSWKTNPYGISYFNTLTAPCNFRAISAVIATATGVTPAAITYPLGNVQEYQVTQNQTSTLLYAASLARKTITPFFQIRSSILQDQFLYHGGSKPQSSRLPCVCLVNKSQPGADYYTETSGGISYNIKNRLILNNIVTEIYDNLGNLAANISPYSSIVYRIEKVYNVKPVTPYQTLAEYQMNQMNQEEKKPQKKSSKK